jgi:hypothetical protein
LRAVADGISHNLGDAGKPEYDKTRGIAVALTHAANAIDLARKSR